MEESPPGSRRKARNMTPKSRAAEYEQKLAIQPTEPVYNDDGVDLLQIREFLELTPLERLLSLETWARTILSARVIREHP